MIPLAGGGKVVPRPLNSSDGEEPPSPYVTHAYAAHRGNYAVVATTIEDDIARPWPVDQYAAPYWLWSSILSVATGNTFSKVNELVANGIDGYLTNDLPGSPTGTTAFDGLAYTPTGTLAAWGRWTESDKTWPKAAAVWLAGDVTSVLKTVIFDELPGTEAPASGTDQRVGGVLLPSGGIAVQVGRAIAWTDAAGNKIGYALIPAAQAGLRMFGTWPDGSIGLYLPGGGRLARIPWDWSATQCP